MILNVPIYLFHFVWRDHDFQALRKTPHLPFCSPLQLFSLWLKHCLLPISYCSVSISTCSTGLFQRSPNSSNFSQCAKGKTQTVLYRQEGGREDPESLLWGDMTAQLHTRAYAKNIFWASRGSIGGGKEATLLSLNLCSIIYQLKFWANYLTLQCLSFPFCNTRMKIFFHSIIVRNK